MNRNKYKVDFSIDNLSLKEQQEVFEAVLSVLDYTERQNFHISVTDSLGGVHYFWDNKGIDPNGIECKKCKMIDCDHCIVYEMRENNGKNNNNN